MEEDKRGEANLKSKYIKWILISLTLSIITGIGTYVYMRDFVPAESPFKNPIKNNTAEKNDDEKKPYDEWLSKERSRGLAVVIDNAIEARPQSGLEFADVIYEIPVEGGITRLLPIITTGDVDLVGPVRSVRTAIVDICREYDGILVHAGGSEDGLVALENYMVNHLDEIYGGPRIEAAFWRVPDRQKPHNLYASFDSLRQACEGEKFKLDVPPRTRTYLEDGEEIKGKLISDISIYYPNRDNQVRFVYDKEKLLFDRYTAEKPHLTTKGEQLVAANVIVQFVPFQYLDGDGHMRLILHGEGEALVFRYGRVVEGYWKKEPNGFTKYIDKYGKEVSLAPGPTWIEIVKKGTRTDY